MEICSDRKSVVPYAGNEPNRKISSGSCTVVSHGF